MYIEYTPIPAASFILFAPIFRQKGAAQGMLNTVYPTVLAAGRTEG